MMLAWQVWKARCKAVFEDKRCIPEDTIKLTLTGSVGRPPLCQSAQSTYTNTREQSADPEKGYSVWTDGSFDSTDMGGAAYLLYFNNQLIRYEARTSQKAVSPFHMEVTALLMAVKLAANMHIDRCRFLTDCKLLVDSLDPIRRFQPLLAADWRSYAELSQIANIFRANPLYCCEHISREENDKAHLIANWARKEQSDYVGFTFPLFRNLVQ